MADNLNEVNTEETKGVTLPSYYENAPYEDKTVESVEEKAEENREKEEKTYETWRCWSSQRRQIHPL